MQLSACGREKNYLQAYCCHIFTVHPEEAERLYREAMEYEAEEEKRQAEIADKLPALIHKMKKGDIEAALLQVLYDDPEWQYDKFLREYFIFINRLFFVYCSQLFLVR